jgi:hypothetical protein
MSARSHLVWLLTTVSERAAGIRAKRLVALRRGRLRRNRSARRGFERRLSRTWRKAFDLFDLTALEFLELGAAANRSARPEAASAQDFEFEALVRLHARGCRVSGEIGSLMRGGYPEGVAARGRTLHEAAVIAFAIQEGGLDVAERYLLHDAIGRAEDAREYFKHQAEAGLEPVTADEVKEVEQVAQDLEAVSEVGRTSV